MRSSSSSLVLIATVCVVAVLALSTISGVHADTPANCLYVDFIGHWSLTHSAPISPTYNCSLPNTTTSISGVGFTLSYPNTVVDDQGNTGNWTLIYNQGVEVWIGAQILLLFSSYASQNSESYCDVTQYGWQHDQFEENWMCINAERTTETKEQKKMKAQRIKAAKKAKHALRTHATAAHERMLDQPYHVSSSYLNQINSAQSHFTVKHYPEYEHMTVRQMQQRSGGVGKASLHDMIPPMMQKNKKQHHQKSRKSPLAKFTAAAAAANGTIPDAFDWRNVSGVNYVSPVRLQGNCGSCYAFASAGMMEARIRVWSQNEFQPILSTQDVVSCSFYSQGCSGGFPYLIAGKYAHDYGMAEEACYPYTGNQTACGVDMNPTSGCTNPGGRWFSQEYYYIGGYYGESTPELMQAEILANGPIAVSFEVYADFQNYAGGVYTHQFTKDIKPTVAGRFDGTTDFDPFHLTNHVVVVVGWGVTQDAAQTPYWIVKNSWGPQWGENGFFRILRGSDEAGGECAIESLTVGVIPIV